MSQLYNKYQELFDAYYNEFGCFPKFDEYFTLDDLIESYS